MKKDLQDNEYKCDLPNSLNVKPSTLKAASFVFPTITLFLAAALLTTAGVSADKALDELHAKNPSAYLKKTPDSNIGVQSDLFRAKFASLLEGASS